MEIRERERRERERIIEREVERRMRERMMGRDRRYYRSFFDDNIFNRNNRGGLTQNEINRLGEDKYIPNSEHKTCVICCENFIANDTIRRLDCLHIFHKNCIDKWLIENNHCPVCKYEIKV